MARSVSHTPHTISATAHPTQYAFAALMEALLPVSCVSEDSRQIIVFLTLFVNSLLFAANMMVAVVQVILIMVQP